MSYGSENPEFVFILDICAEDWKPKLKILTDYDLIAVENSEIEVLCDKKHIYSVNSTIFWHIRV